MEISALKEFYCDICFKMFGEDVKCPRILPCGHSFCQSCIDELLRGNSTCPTCNNKFIYTSVNSMPINYIARSLSLRLCRQPFIAPIEETSSQALNLGQSLTSSPEVNLTVGEQPVSEVINLKLAKLKADVENLNELLDTDHSCKTITENTIKGYLPPRSTQGLCEQIRNIEGNFIKIIELWKHERISQFMRLSRIPRNYNFRLTIEGLRTWCREEPVYAFRQHYQKTQFGKLSVKGNKIWIDCFQTGISKENRSFIEFRELLLTFNGSPKLPQRAFLQLQNFTEVTTPPDDIVITTDGLTSRASNFLLLSSGLKERSYKRNILVFHYGKFNYDITIMPSPFKTAAAVVKGITNGGHYEAPAVKGFVYGWHSTSKHSLALFSIWMKDDPSWRLYTKFGTVEEGLESCERIFKQKQKYYIKNCGLVI